MELSGHGGIYGAAHLLRLCLRAVDGSWACICLTAGSTGESPVVDTVSHKVSPSHSLSPVGSAGSTSRILWEVQKKMRVNAFFSFLEEDRERRERKCGEGQGGRAGRRERGRERKKEKGEGARESGGGERSQRRHERTQPCTHPRAHTRTHAPTHPSIHPSTLPTLNAFLPQEGEKDGRRRKERSQLE